MSDAAANPLKAGLEDVVVSTSDICCIDGHKGRLLYRGYDVDDLVAQSAFEEVTYLLWYGSLPTRKELDVHAKALSSTANRKLPPKLMSMLRLFPKKTTPMEILRTGVSALSAWDPDAADNSRDATLRKAMRLTAQMPTLVAAWDRFRRGFRDRRAQGAAARRRERAGHADGGEDQGPGQGRALDPPGPRRQGAHH